MCSEQILAQVCSGAINLRVLGANTCSGLLGASCFAYARSKYLPRFAWSKLLRVCSGARTCSEQLQASPKQVAPSKPEQVFAQSSFKQVPSKLLRRCSGLLGAKNCSEQSRVALWSHFCLEQLGAKIFGGSVLCVHIIVWCTRTYRTLHKKEK